jgi:hypothetical protein
MFCEYPSTSVEIRIDRPTVTTFLQYLPNVILNLLYRLETVMKGREDREKFGSRKGKLNEHASTTNKQKLKNKNFMMLKHKLKGKAKKSFVEKQKHLKKSMLRSKKFK